MHHFKNIPFSTLPYGKLFVWCFEICISFFFIFTPSLKQMFLLQKYTSRNSFMKSSKDCLRNSSIRSFNNSFSEFSMNFSTALSRYFSRDSCKKSYRDSFRSFGTIPSYTSPEIPPSISPKIALGFYFSRNTS